MVDPVVEESRKVGTIGNIEPYTPGTNFFAYSRRVKNYFKTNRIGEDEQTSAFITLGGQELYELLMSLTTPILPDDKTFNQLIEILETYFEPQRNQRMQRYKFYKAVQEEGETVSDFIVRLKVLSKSCDFAKLLPSNLNIANLATVQQHLLGEMLLDRFIFGLRSESIRNNLMKQKDINFENACEEAINIELLSEDQREMKLSSQLMINAISTHNGTNQQVQNQSSQIQSVQKSYSHRNNNNNSSFKRSSSSGQRTFNRRNNNFVRNQNEKKCGRCGRQHDEKNCPAVNWQCFFCNRKGHTSVVCRDKQRRVNVIKSIRNQNIPLTLQIKVNNQLLEMEIDSGACTTIISHDEYLSKFKKCKLTNIYDPNLTSLSGHVLKSVGQFNVEVFFHGVVHNLEMSVVNIGKEFKAILGRPWLDRLIPGWRNMFDSNVSVNIVNNNDLSEIVKTKYPNIVNQKLNSSISGFEADLVLKEGKTPIFHAAYDVPFKLKEKVESEIKKLCFENVLEPIKYSQWASPIVIVPKSNGSIRICLDGKVTLNKCIQTEHYPLPVIDDIFPSLSNCKFFSVIDLKGAYQQVKLSENSKNLLVINTCIGLYRYTRLTFGLNCAASAFQQIMEQILQGLENVRVFQDDIIIGGINREHATKNVLSVCGRLSEYNVKVNIEKCKFLKNSVKYLGHIITSEGIKPNDEKVKAIVEAPEPQNIQQLQSYIGLLNFYRKFIPNLSSELNVLYSLLNKNVEYKWSDECSQSFKKSKQLILNSNMLEIFDPKKPIVVSTDASPYGVGAILSHVVNGEEKPVMFASSTLSQAERNYSQVHREALAIIFAIKKFYKYLYGQFFTIYTDNSAVRDIFNPKKGTSSVAAARLQRWSIKLSMFDYDIKHRSANKMCHSDALSRLPLKEEQTCIKSISYNFLNTNQEMPLDFKKVADETKKDKILSKVFHCVMNGWSNKIENELLYYFRLRDSISTEENCLFYRDRIIIPSSQKFFMLKTLHENHTGIVRMKMIARSYVWWKNIDKEIEDYVRQCEVCIQTQCVPKEKVETKWKETTFPFERVHIDFFDFAGKRFLLLVDAFSKYCDIKIVNGTKAENVIDKLIEMFSIFGFAKQIVSDNGPPFQSASFIKFCTLNGMEVLKSPPYHPQSNGLAERGVRTVKTVFKKYYVGNEHSLSTDQMVRKFLLYHRNTPTTVHGRTPSSILFSFKPRIALDLIKKPNSENNNKERINQEKINCQENHKEKKSENVQMPFDEGQKVYYLSHVKQYMRWIPATIKKILSPLRFLIEVNNEIRHVHKNQLKKIKEPNSELFLTDGKIKENTFENSSEYVPRPIRKRKRTDRYNSVDFRSKHRRTSQ